MDRVKGGGGVEGVGGGRRGAKGERREKNLEGGKELGKLYLGCSTEGGGRQGVRRRGVGGGGGGRRPIPLSTASLIILSKIYYLQFLAKYNVCLICRI